MKAARFNLPRSLCLLIVSIIGFFGHGCTSVKTPPSLIHTPPPTVTSTQQSFRPTATAIIPTTAPPSPTATPFDPTRPDGALVRINLGSVELIALSQGGDWIAAAGATHICLYATADFEQIWCTPSSLPEEYEKWSSLKENYEKFVSTLVFSPDASQIAYASWYGAVVLLDSTTGQRMEVIEGDPQNSIKELVWALDNDHLIVWSFQGGVDIWNIPTGDKEGHLEIDPAQIQSAAWTPDGKIAALSLKESGVISLWDMLSLEQTASVDTLLPDYGFKLALSPDGSTVYASVYTLMGACGADLGDQGWIKAWDIATSELIFDTDMNGACLQRMSVSPDGHELAGITGYGKLKILGTYSGNIVFDPPYNFFKSMVWWGSDRFLFVHSPSYPNWITDFKSIGVMDMHFKWITPILLPGFETIYSLAWLPEGQQLVTNSAGGTISIWEAAAGRRMEQFQVTLEGVALTSFGPASISPVDGTLAIPAHQSVALIDLETRQYLNLMEFEPISSKTHAVYADWSDDGKRLAAHVYDSGSYIVIWDAATGKEIVSIPFENHGSSIRDLAISPDGTKLALSEFLISKNILSFWDIETNQERASIETYSHDIIWINQSQVASSNSSWIEIYDMTTGKKVRNLAEGYTYAVSPGNSLVAAEILLEGITISDFNSGKMLDQFSLEPVFIRRLAISPDGKLLAGLTEFGSVIIWDISSYFNQ